MRALVWNGRELKLEEACRRPKPSPGMALVRVHLAGICATDLQIFKGYMGFQGIPGHEFMGVVVEGPDGLAGKRVVGEINFACGNCEWCRRGLDRHCPTRNVMGILNADGCFAEYVAVPTANLHVVPDPVDDEEAVFTEPLAAAFEILEQVDLNIGDRVLVLGDGKLGLLCAQVLNLTGAGVTVVGKHKSKFEKLKASGIRTVLLQNYKEDRFDVVVEATGTQKGLELALASARPRGSLILKSTLAEKHEVSLAPIVINEINVIGSRCGPFLPALKALQDKSIQVKPIIETVYPLHDGLIAVAHAGRAGALKVLLRMDS